MIFFVLAKQLLVLTFLCNIEELESETVSSLFPLLCEPLQYRGEVLETRETVQQNKVRRHSCSSLNS